MKIGTQTVRLPDETYIRLRMTLSQDHIETGRTFWEKMTCIMTVVTVVVTAEAGQSGHKSLHFL